MSQLPDEQLNLDSQLNHSHSTDDLPQELPANLTIPVRVTERSLFDRMWYSVSGFFSRPKKQQKKEIECQPCEMTIHNLSEVPIESRNLALNTISSLPKPVSQKPVITSSQLSIAVPPLEYAPLKFRQGGIKRQFPENDFSPDKNSHKRFNAGHKDDRRVVDEVQEENNLGGNSKSTIIQDTEKLKLKPVARHKLSRLEAKAKAKKSDSESNSENKSRRSESSVERDIEKVKDDLRIKNPQCCKVHDSLNYVKSEIDKMELNIRNIIDEKLSEFIEVKKLNFKAQMERRNRIKNMFLKKKKKTVDVEIQADIQHKLELQKKTDSEFEEPISTESGRPRLINAVPKVPSLTEGLFGKKIEKVKSLDNQTKIDIKPPSLIANPALPTIELKPLLGQSSKLGESGNSLFSGGMSAKSEEKDANKDTIGLLAGIKTTEAKNMFSGGGEPLMNLLGEKKLTPSDKPAEDVKDTGSKNTSILFEDKLKAPENTSSTSIPLFSQLTAKPAPTEKQMSLLGQDTNKLFSTKFPAGDILGGMKPTATSEKPATSNAPSEKPEEKLTMDGKMNPFLMYPQNPTPPKNQLFGGTTQPKSEPQTFFGGASGLFQANLSTHLFGKPPDNKPAIQGNSFFGKPEGGSLFCGKLELQQPTAPTSQSEPQAPRASPLQPSIPTGSILGNASGDNGMVFGESSFKHKQPGTSLFNTNTLFSDTKPLSNPVPFGIMNQGNTGGLFNSNTESSFGTTPSNNQLFGLGSSTGLLNPGVPAVQNIGGGLFGGGKGITSQMGSGLPTNTQAPIFTLGKKKN